MYVYTSFAMFCNAKGFSLSSAPILIRRLTSWTKSRQKKVLRVFLLAIHSHLSFPWDFYLFKLKQPFIVSTVPLLYTVKKKAGKPDRKPCPLLYELRIHRETSRLCPETLTKLYVHEIGFYTFRQEVILCNV
jgi:hypothetical protein